MPEVGDEEAYAERIERLAGDLPVVFFVKNSSLFVGELLEAAEAAINDKEEQPGDAGAAGDHPLRDATQLPG